jgi:hypothetical protein
MRYNIQAFYLRIARKRDGAGLAGASRRKISGGSIPLKIG